MLSVFCTASALVLSACGGSGSTSPEQLDTAAHTAAANSKHEAQTLESTPAKQRHKSGLLGASPSSYPAGVRKHGRVVDVIQAWPKNNSELLVTYVVYGFVSPELYQTGAIPASGSATTEVWRYSPGGGGTWCPIITAGLGFSVAGIQALPTLNDQTSSAVNIRFITGSTDGVVGRVEFRDNNPLASNCDNIATDIQPLPNKANFYSVIQPAISIGSIEKFKLVDIDEGKTLTAAKKYDGYQYLFSWGLPTCAGAWAIGTDGKCGTFGVSQLRSLLLKNGEPVQGATLVFQEPHGNRASNFDVNTVTDFDARIKANADGGIDFAYATAFLHTTTNSKLSDRLRFGKTSVKTLTDVIPEPVWIDAIDQSLVSSRAMPQQVVISPTADMVYVTYHGLSAPDKAQVLCDFSTQACKALNPLTSNPAFPALESKFAPIRSFVPNDTAAAQAFNPREYMMRVAPYFTNVPIPVIENLALSTRTSSAYGVVGAGQMLLDRNMLFQYKHGNPATSYSSITGMAIGQFESFAVFNADNNQTVVHQLFQFNDYGGYDEDDTQHQDVHGGIAYCVFPVNADGSLGINACTNPRLGQANGVGSAYATAAQIAKGGSYMTSPSMIRYSVSPKGTVHVTYISKAGAISTIDASEKTTNWTGSNAWITISGGQAAECNAVLTKPMVPNPIPADNFWDSLKQKAVAGTASYLAKAILSEAAGPIVGWAAGKGVDYLFGMGERAALEKKQADQYDAWVAVYDAIKLKTACKIQ